MRRRHGFTLIELMVVIAIIGMLASVVAFSLSNVLSDTMPKKVQADFVQFRDAIDMYRLKTKKWPQRLDDLVTAGVIVKLQKDPWGHDYAYTPPTGTKSYLITSYGADGAPGGTGDNEDLTTDDIDDVIARRDSEGH